ncbi:MAG: hypothetical protein ACOYT4_00995 [Nanoarchaeota archaeon]
MRKENENNSKAKNNKLANIIILILIAVIIIGTATYALSNKKFKYAGFEWEKVDYNGLKFYHSTLNDYNLYLRNDPRENDIPLDANFKFHRNVIVSMDKDAGECKEAVMANTVLGSFLGPMNLGLNAQGALNDETAAQELGFPFANCSNAVDNTTVILMHKSEIPGIFEDKNKDCIILNVGDCQNIKTVERFIVGVLSQATNE